MYTYIHIGYILILSTLYVHPQFCTSASPGDLLAVVPLKGPPVSFGTFGW